MVINENKLVLSHTLDQMSQMTHTVLRTSEPESLNIEEL